MNAAVVESFGAPPRYTQFLEPEAAAGELLVHVKAAGLHHVVRGIAGGRHYGSTVTPPFVPGIDGAGTLEDGRRVYFLAARSPYGSFAERSLTLPSLCLPLPDGVDDVTAAGSANAAMSAWVALTARAHFKRGESVLVLGATGVSGSLAVQIAKRLGARRVVAAGRNRGALDALGELGADAVIALDAQRERIVSLLRREIEENGIDVVLDYLWGTPAEIVLESIEGRGLHRAAPRIRYVEIGAAAGSTITLPGATLRSSGLEILGSGFGSASSEQILHAIGHFFTEAAKSQFNVAIRTAPLRDVEALWKQSDERARLVFEL